MGSSFDSEIEAVMVEKRKREVRNESIILWPGLWFQGDRDISAFRLQNEIGCALLTHAHTHTHTHTRTPCSPLPSKPGLDSPSFVVEAAGNLLPQI